MSLVFGGTTVNNIVFNGTTVDRIVFNGVEVYTSTISYPYLYLNGRVAEGWAVSSPDGYGAFSIYGKHDWFGHLKIKAYISNWTDFNHKPYLYIIIKTRNGRSSGEWLYAYFDQNSKTSYTDFNLNDLDYTYRINIMTRDFISPEYATITEITYTYPEVY